MVQGRIAKTDTFNKPTGVNMNELDFPKNEQAFPDEFNDGMTLRDYFAAKALQGCISGTPHSVDIEPTELAKWCYIMADRMLEARGE
jgi:hypothetical protein